MLNEKTFGKNRRCCFKITLMHDKKVKYIQKFLIIVYRKKLAQIESLAIYCKSNLKKHSNIKIEEILSLCFWDSHLLENTYVLLGDDTNSNIISYVSLRVKIKTWSLQRETNHVKDIFSIHAYKGSDQRKQTKSSSKF